MKNLKIAKIITYILVIVILAYYGLNFYISEKKNYNKYNDYTRGSTVQLCTFYKDFGMQFEIIRTAEAVVKGEKITQGELIYDFKNYDIIPILNYINEIEENQDLVDSFSKIMEFFADYNYLSHRLSEEVFENYGKNKDYYEIVDDSYVYKVKKKVIKKEQITKIYNEYLLSKNYSNALDNFISKLYEKTEINTKYSVKSLKEEILSNYKTFYNKYKDYILQVISADLNDFATYAINEYYEFDVAGNLLKLKKEPTTEELKLFFRFKELDRVYNSISKYFSHSYILDLNDVFEQLKQKNYPKLYM